MEPHSPTEQSSDPELDSFDDAKDTAPHLSSPSSGHSLINRSRSSSAEPNLQNKDQEPVASQENGELGLGIDGADEARVNGVEQSPKASVKRISVGSLDEVNLEGDANKPSTTKSNPVALQGLSGQLPENEFPPPPPPPPPPTSVKSANMAPPPPPARKYTSPFSWLTRSSGSADKTKENTITLPNATSSRDRKNTITSITTINSNPELMVSKLDHENGGSPSRGPGRNSLKDRFKLLRLREEAGITSLDNELPQAGPAGRSMSIGANSAEGTPDEKRDTTSPTHTASSPRPHSPSRQPTINHSLAPGTVSGLAVGPASESSAPVDWDLWQSVVYEGPAAVARTSPEELNQAIASGIPQAIRGVVWQVLAESKNEDLETMYRELVARGTDKEVTGLSGQTSSTKGKESIKSSASSTHSNHSTPATATSTTQESPVTSPSSPDALAADAIAKMQAERASKQKEEKAAIAKLEKVIRRDLGARTSYSKYLMSAGLQEGLFGVCKAYALFDEAVGYAQGMNFIAMPLLFNMTEEEAFCLLVKLMNKYGLREMFIQDMPGLHLHLYQFERLLEDFEPALYCHLNRRGVHPQLYATQWFLTLFAYRFPLQLVLRIYDLILSEGLEGAILKFGIVLMQKNAQTLLGMKDMASLSVFLKERLFDVYIDKAPSANSLLESGFFGSAGGVDKEIYRADVLVQDACGIKITAEMLKGYTDEWNEKQRTEKDREMELENLRQSNSDLQKRVRNLEERIEKSDTEHVQVASEVVRTKVENEGLKDENESLQGEVKELKDIIDKQPKEVEDRLKNEMERIMARNLEVQNENRALEEQMAEMETSLVEAKLKYAEVDSEYETLKQKWNNITSMLNSK